MNETRQINEPPILWVGLTNDLLDPIPNQTSNAPFEFSTEDAEELLHAFQQLVYSTVAISTGRSRTNDVRGDSRHQYELVVADTSINSFFVGFRVHRDARNQKHSEDTVYLTVSLTFAALDRLVEWYDNAIDVALDMAPGATAVLLDAIQPIIQSHVGHPIDDLTRDQIILFVSALAAFIKIGRKHNRRMSARRNLHDEGPTVTRKQTDAALRAEEQIRATQAQDESGYEWRDFGPAFGNIERVDREAHEIRVRFSTDPYVESIRCGYGVEDQHYLGNLNEGDPIKISGNMVLPNV